MAAKRFLFVVCTGLLFLSAVHQFAAKSAHAQTASNLLSMTDYPGLGSSAVAVDESGGIYFGHSKQWTRVGTTPGAPASIWSRPSTGEIFVAMKNGDLYQLGSDWTLTLDSNVFAGVPTPVQRTSLGALKVKYR